MLPTPLQHFLLMLLATASCAAVEVQVIANPDCHATSLRSDDLADLYLGKKSKWGNGAKAVVLTNANLEETERFLAQHLERTPAAFSAAWKRLVFTGKGTPPAEARDDRDMVELVRKTPGAIGYVSAGTPAEGVITLTVTK
jgi:ABC-type phosphate transport system substrate-binding protein